jgi:hypothetical protein
MNQPRVLMLTPRRYERAVWRCAQVEFEDLISAIDDVEMVAPEAVLRGQGRFARHATRVAQRLANMEIRLTPRITSAPIDREYELFACYAAQPADLRLLDAVPNWRRRCKKAVCFVDEFWVEHFADDARWLERLSNFDLVAVMFYNTVEPLQKLTGAPCVWVPAGVDTLRFFPGIVPPLRSIDVYAMGRRSEHSHEVLLSHASAHNWTYLFDTIEPVHVRDGFQDHRQQLAEILKRTRYFIANKAKVDVPAHRGTQEEIGLRSFEGAAGGAVLLGHTPDTPVLDRLFDWPDAHVHVPFGSREIADVIHQLDADPERVNAIRRNNVVNSLRRNDWALRWQLALNKLDISPTARLGERLNTLDALATSVDREDWPGVQGSISGLSSAPPAAITGSTHSEGLG